MTIVRTDSGLARSARVRTAPLVARHAIDIEDLLLRLAEAGRPAGLIRMQGETRIVAMTETPIFEEPAAERPG